MSEPQVNDFAVALVEELAGIIGTATEASVTTSRAAVDAAAGWVLTVTAGGSRTGVFSAWIDRTGATALTRLVTKATEDPDDQAVANTLSYMWTQAANAVSTKPAFAGVVVEVTGLLEGEAEPTDRVGFVLDLAGQGTIQIVLSGELAAPVPRATTRSTNLEVVLDMELPLVVRFGRTAMSLKALSALGPGSIVSMGRSPDEDVELLVSGHVIARGEVVIVDGNYGVRVTDLVSPAERAKGLVEV